MSARKSGKYKNGKGIREVNLNIILGEETVVCLLIMSLSEQSTASLPAYFSYLLMTLVSMFRNSRTGLGNGRI